MHMYCLRLKELQKELQAESPGRLEAGDLWCSEQRRQVTRATHNISQTIMMIMKLMIIPSPTLPWEADCSRGDNSNGTDMFVVFVSKPPHYSCCACGRRSPLQLSPLHSAQPMGSGKLLDASALLLRL